MTEVMNDAMVPLGIGIILGLLNWIAGPSIIGIFLGAWFGVLLGNFILKFDC